MKDGGFTGNYKDIKERGVYYREFEMTDDKVLKKKLQLIHQKIRIPNFNVDSRVGFQLTYTERYHKIAYARDDGHRVGNMIPEVFLVSLNPSISAEESMALIAQRSLGYYTHFNYKCQTTLEHCMEVLQEDKHRTAQDEKMDRTMCEREIDRHTLEKRVLRITCTDPQHFPQLQKVQDVPGVEEVTPESATTIKVKLSVFGAEKELRETTEWYYDGHQCIQKAEVSSIDIIDDSREESPKMVEMTEAEIWGWEPDA
jgi:hypothetical protein